MRIFKNKNFLVLLFLSSIIFVLFWQFFLKGLYPFPGNYLLAWYEPWKTDFFTNGVISISHKPVADDVFRQLYPFKILATSMIKQLQLPLWNPYSGSGMPLLATMHMGFLNPANLFFIVLPNYLAWSLYIVIQPFLICFFTYLYCRKIKLTIVASLFSTFSFLLSGFVITRLIFGEYIYSFSILPLLLYLIEIYVKNNKSKLILFLPLAILFLFITGQPQVIFYVLVVCISYLIYRCLKLQKNIFLFIFFIFLGAGFASIQLFPTVELFFNSSITHLSSKFIFDRFLLPIQHLVSILIPNYFGNQATYNYWGHGDYIEAIGYFGLVPSFFAYLTFLNKKSNIVKFFIVALFLTVVLSLDWFGTRLVFSFPIPILSTGNPARILAITTFSLSILAGFGFDYWIKLKEKIIPIYKIFIFCLLIFTILAITFSYYKLGISCHNDFIANCRFIALRNTLFEIGFFIIFIIIYSLNIYLKKKRFSQIIFSFIALTLVLISGLYNSNKFLPFSKKETFLPKNALLNIFDKTKDARIFEMGDASIKTDFATYFKFYDPNYYDPLYNKRYGELIAFANSGSFPSVLPRSDVEIANEITPQQDKNQRRNRLLDILGVKYLVFKKPLKNFKSVDIFWQDNNWIILKNNVLPRFYFVNEIEVIKEKGQILKRLFDPSFNPRQKVILEIMPFKFQASEKLNYESISLKSYEPNTIILQSNEKISKILVLSDNYYPGWKAYIDGKETKIYRANYTFRAIVLPEGKHDILFKYEPLSLQIGLWVSSFSIGVFILILIRTFWAKSKR